MKYTISSQHQSFFQENGYIAFEGLVQAMPPGTGRNLWQRDEEVAKISRSNRFAKIMGDLANRFPIRLACDWGGFHPTGTLQAQLSFQGLIGGLILLPDGSGYFVTPTCLLVDLNLNLELDYFLIAYAGHNACYIYNKRDPFTHNLKELGYAFGDNLQAKFHPILAH